MVDNEVVCVGDFESRARKCLPIAIHDFIETGATELQTLRDNVQAFSRYVCNVCFLCPEFPGEFSQR